MINLKEIRKSCGYTQIELVNILGIKQQQYSRYEHGIRKISLDLYLKILDVCGYKMGFKKIYFLNF